MSQTTKKITMVLGVLILLASGYYIVVSLMGTEVVQLDTSSDLARTSEKLLNDIQRIQDISLNEDLFTDVRFTSLKDTRVELVDIPTGRANPFAPIQ